MGLLLLPLQARQLSIEAVGVHIVMDPERLILPHRWQAGGLELQRRVMVLQVQRLQGLKRDLRFSGRVLELVGQQAGRIEYLHARAATYGAIGDGQLLAANAKAGLAMRALGNERLAHATGIEGWKNGR